MDALPSLPETPPSEPVCYEGDHREDEEDDEDYLGPFPRKVFNLTEAEQGSDQSDHDEHDSKP